MNKTFVADDASNAHVRHKSIPLEITRYLHTKLSFTSRLSFSCNKQYIILGNAPLCMSGLVPLAYGRCCGLPIITTVILCIWWVVVEFGDRNYSLYVCKVHTILCVIEFFPDIKPKYHSGFIAAGVHIEHI